jgi:hypothetical protein
LDQASKLKELPQTAKFLRLFPNLPVTAPKEIKGIRPKFQLNGASNIGRRPLSELLKGANVSAEDFEVQQRRARESQAK